MITVQASSVLLKAQGARILSELNDLKRTSDSCADELGWSREEVAHILAGNTTPERMNALIEKLSHFYPIDRAELMLPQDDCQHGVKIMREESSKASARVFNRRNRTGEKTPYYEYRDTAMSRVSAFRPEWIKELRFVADNAPDNPDVAYNNGHFMHQVTYFVGPVNFYYEIHGEKHCVPMNTGDSNYITPYWPHSFTTRDANQEAYIIAVTFGGDVKRLLGELYRYEQDRFREFLIDMRHPAQASQDLLDFHLRNELLTRKLLQQKLLAAGETIDVLNPHATLERDALITIAQHLSVDVSDLTVPEWRTEEEVVIKKADKTQGYFYPDATTPHYQIFPGARCLRMPQVKAFNIQVLATATLSENQVNQASGKGTFSSALHTYVYNYSQALVQLNWTFQGLTHQETLYPGDSAYVQPFIAYQFSKMEESSVNKSSEPSKEAWLFTVGIPGALHFGAQKELSSFANCERVIAENKCWFNA